MRKKSFIPSAENRIVAVKTGRMVSWTREVLHADYCLLGSQEKKEVGEQHC